MTLSQRYARWKANRIARRIKSDWLYVQHLLIQSGWPRSKRRQFLRDLINGVEDLMIRPEWVKK